MSIYFFKIKMMDILDNNNKYLISITFYGNMLCAMIIWSFTFTLFYMIYFNLFVSRKSMMVNTLLYQFLNFESYLIGLYLFLNYNMILYNIIILIEILMIAFASFRLFNIDYDGLFLLMCENIILAITILIAVIFSDLCEPKIIEIY